VTSRDAAWLAGLLEGEGYFIERKGSGRNPRPLIGVKMTDRDVVERVAKLFGTSVTTVTHPREGWKTSYVTRVGGLKAISIMKQILPYMGERRTEAIEMLIYLYEDAPVGRQPTCACGNCPKCRQRKAVARYRKRKKEEEATI
jgi:LAGLIDADG-like domain